MSFVRSIIALFVFASVLFADTGISSTAEQGRILQRYFAKQLDVPATQIEITLIHTSDIAKALFRKGEIHVQRGRGAFNLGHQTLWLVHKRNGIIEKRYPVTIDVHAHMDVPVAGRNISRLETVTEDLLVTERKRIGREFKRLILDRSQLVGQMATQSIREGRTFQRNSVRMRPDVLLGDELQIILQNEGLSLELPGIAKEEALIGEEIRVQCPTTRKEFRGILENEREVVVSLR